ncbi:MAG: Na+/H+ antiporter subunit E [Alphaproteobacteria bacterium]|nr:Na+/H+ antiporter subunit E [Alphaproteobacteria bacterium]
MKYVIAALSLAGMWFLWSGQYTLHHGLVAFFGVASIALVLWLSHRLDIIDAEGQPLLLGGGLVTYGPWLAKEIVKANIDVAKRIVNPAMPISPNVIRVESVGTSDLAHVVFANSITLTPGTLSMDIEEGVITVHALSKEGGEDVLAGEMNRRCAALEERL